jgi:hypothetical protein
MNIVENIIYKNIIYVYTTSYAANSILFLYYSYHWLACYGLIFVILYSMMIDDAT